MIQKAVPVKRGAETYLNVTDFSFTIDTKRLHLHFENLFNGNRELGKSRCPGRNSERTRAHGALHSGYEPLFVTCSQAPL